MSDHWILSASGKKIDFIDPDPMNFNIDDIARGLSNVCRFAGQIPGGAFYSVAQHSVWVARRLPIQDRLAGLLHDASEAYLGDLASPLKAILPGYKEIEQRIQRTILIRFGIYPDIGTRTRVKAADMLALEAEGHKLCHWGARLPGRRESLGLVNDIDIRHRPPNDSYAEFLAFYSDTVSSMAEFGLGEGAPL